MEDQDTYQAETEEELLFEEDIEDDESVEDIDESQVSSSDTLPVRQVRMGFEEIARKVSDKEKLDDDELDLVADIALEIIRTLLSYFDIEATSIDEYDEGGELTFNVTGDDLGIMIGYHGKVLEAFQYMFTSLLNRSLGFRFPARVDIEGYENRHNQKLESIAHSAARRAVQRGQEVRMRPMKPFERRIVHLSLRDDQSVTTHSEGEEPNRYVVVRPSAR